jgi:hypothetical protein
VLACPFGICATEFVFRPDGGHYYACCRPNDGKDWVKFDDDHVIFNIEPIITCDAYMLFFRRVSKVFKLALLPTDYDEEQLLENTLSGDDPSAIVADILICGRSATVHVKNLQCLLPDEPLNSETINFYVLMVEAAAAKRLKVISFNSFFMSKIEKEVS